MTHDCTDQDFNKNSPTCHYCGKNSAPNDFIYYEGTLYWVEKRTAFPLGYNYKDISVSIPRCASCYAKHMKVLNKVLFTCLPIGYGLATIGLYYLNDKSFYAEDGSWLGIAFIIFILGSFFSGALMWLMDQLLSLGTGIPPESDIEDYPPVAHLLKDGWIRNRPDPASHPETGEERREHLKSL